MTTSETASVTTSVTTSVTASVTTCLLLRPYRRLTARDQKSDVDGPPHEHSVVETDSPCAVGVEVCPAAPLSAGFNPYFDLPPA